MPSDEVMTVSIEDELDDNGQDRRTLQAESTPICMQSRRLCYASDTEIEVELKSCGPKTVSSTLHYTCTAELVQYS